jgi:prepilin-type N-terminal cleavage/methylation domain-containing protein
MNNKSPVNQLTNSPINQEGGFTLIELLVAAGIFAIVITAVSGIFISSVNSQRKAMALQATQEASRFMFESMAKEVRMSVLNTNTNTNTSISITNSDNVSLNYAFSGGKLYRADRQISPDNIEITQGRFRVEQLVAPNPEVVKITIVMAVRGRGTKIAEQTVLNLQTTVAQRAQKK